MEETPDEIKNLLIKFRDEGRRGMSDEEFSVLSEFLVDKEVTKVVMVKPFNYSKKQYNTLMAIMTRTGFKKAPKEISTESELKRHERKALADHIDTEWDEAHLIAMGTIRRWEQHAIELGYYDEAKNRVDMQRFVGEACDFFIKYSNKIVELEQDAQANKGLAAMLVECVDKLSQTITLIDAQLDFFEKSYPQLKYQLIPLRVLSDISRYMPRQGEVA